MDLPLTFSATSNASSLTRPVDDDRPSIAGVFQSLQSMETAGRNGREILRHAVEGPLRDRIAVVSSFGAESALLLSILAEIDPSVPVIFLETGKHFPETLAYRDELASYLGLTDIRDVVPGDAAIRDQDPSGELWYYDPDACCALRKVRPLERALAPFESWISGRKRFQAATRTMLPIVEQESGRLKLNPLADWDAARIGQELARRNLPMHPLVERGYPSIGCSVCTRSIVPGEDSRAGRWSGSRKVECGIHAPAPVADPVA